jgi:hypothetical protein
MSCSAVCLKYKENQTNLLYKALVIGAAQGSQLSLSSFILQYQRLLQGLNADGFQILFSAFYPCYNRRLGS